MEEKHTGLIIRESDVGESDRIVTVLTADCGLVRAFARGSKKIKSKMFSSTRIFTFGDFCLHKGRDKYIITDAQRRGGFFGTACNITRLTLAQYVCELCCAAVPFEQPENGELLRLTLNTLYALDKTDKPEGLIKAAFEFKAMALLGYSPDVSGCGQCGEENGEMLFYPEEGTVLCGECAEGHKGGAFLDLSAMSAVRYILSCEGEKIFSFGIPEGSLKRLNAAAEKYVLTQLERSFKTLDFYRTL